jgi:hypothetical protein
VVALAGEHWPPQSGSVAVQGARPPCGLPDGTCPQVPSNPATSQAMHCSVQAALQQTPSTQNPD